LSFVTTTSYVHAGAGFASELERLTLLEARYDGGTVRRIEAVCGSLDGARCLEVGAGAGSTARWLADQVGRHGRVVATDIDCRFLTHLGRRNLEVRQHDIEDDNVEEASYDLVHCRAVLLHLSDPGRALRRMAAALRPGGVLLVEDADFVSLVAALPQHPLAPGFDRTMSRVTAFLASRGCMDPWFGRRLPGLVHGLGLGSGAFETTVARRGGGSPAPRAVHRSGV
jgi:ubiquinone/menaquinone biosynthesis C-methylase UbiE